MNWSFPQTYREISEDLYVQMRFVHTPKYHHSGVLNPVMAIVVEDGAPSYFFPSPNPVGERL